jgi:hypothetical protein
VLKYLWDSNLSELICCIYSDFNAVEYLDSHKMPASSAALGTFMAVR